MKTILMTTLLCCAAVSHASGPDTIYPEMTAKCSDPDTLIATLSEKYGEVPVAAGDGIIDKNKEDWYEGRTIIWIHPDDLTFTVSFFDSRTNLACIVASGSNFSPITDKQAQTMMADKVKVNHTK